MRWIALPFVLLAGAATAVAQDAGAALAQAVQQANDQAIQQVQAASAATMQASEQANQAAMQASQQAAQDASNSAAAAQCVSPKPTFTLAPGHYTGPQQVSVVDEGRQARIFYTTEGWTPTSSSAPFRGPIPVTSTTTLRARAYVPGCWPSQVAEASYTVTGTAPAPPPRPIDVRPDGVLPKGTDVALRFTAPLDSTTATVGQRLLLQPVAPVELGGEAVAPGSVQGVAYVTAVHRPGRLGQPGDIEFALSTLEVGGVAVPLAGQETAEGKDAFDKAKHRILIPIYGFSALGIRGDDAHIDAGAVVHGEVSADTALRPVVAAGVVAEAPSAAVSQ